MRWIAAAIVLSTFLPSYPYAFASHADVVSADDLARLEEKADQAPVRDQCFLFAKLVSRMTEIAGQQISSGQSQQASATLKLVQRYTARINQGLTDKSRKLRNAEILMQRTSFRLKSILGAASYQDQQIVEATLKDLDRVQSQLLMAVFRK